MKTKQTVCRLGTQAAVLAALISGIAATPCSAAMLAGYNLVVLGDLDSNSEVEGRTYVGGDLLGSASNYGVMLSGQVPADDPVLQVAGDITATAINLNAGGMLLGGDVASGTVVNMNSNGEYAVGGSIDGNLNGGTQVPFAGVVSPAAATAHFLGASAAYAATPSNSTPAVTPGLNAIFDADPALTAADLAVFDIDAATLFGSSVSQVEVNLGSAAGAVINVSGVNIAVPSDFNSVGALLTDAVRARVIWNFFDAEQLVIDSQYNGAILAPKAALENSTFLSGEVVVESFVQRGEVHLPPLDIELIPEPSAALLAMAAVLGAVRGRQRDA